MKKYKIDFLAKAYNDMDSSLDVIADKLKNEESSKVGDNSILSTISKVKKSLKKSKNQTS